VKPSIGRIVHYVSYGTPNGEYGKECRAAIVTQVNGRGADERERIGVAVLNPSGMFFHEDLPELDPAVHGHQGGTWHWPEREPSSTAPQVHVNADLSASQVKQVTEMIQVAILQQVKRGRTTALKLQGRS
jgi:hypothetical protein